MDEVFKALGDPTRLKIIRMLAERGEVCVCNFAEELGLSQPAISHHMSTLKHAGLLRSRRDGQWIHYSLDGTVLKEEVLAFVTELVVLAEKARERKDAAARCEDLTEEEETKTP